MIVMNITLGNSVLDYLQKNECNELTIEVIEIDVSTCVGRIPETKINFGSPTKNDEYDSYIVDGIKINLSNTMKADNDLKVVLSGFWFFKHLDLVGHKLVL